MGAKLNSARRSGICWPAKSFRNHEIYIYIFTHIRFLSYTIAQPMCVGPVHAHDSKLKIPRTDEIRANFLLSVEKRIRATLTKTNYRGEGIYVLA